MKTSVQPTRVYTTRQKILLAALDFDAPFTVEALVVRCWQRDPQTFGLRDTAQPHAVLVGGALEGRDGLLARELLEQSVDGTLTVTARGRALADRITAESTVTVAERLVAMRRAQPTEVDASAPPAVATAPATLAPDAPASAMDRRVVASLARCAALVSLERGRPVTLGEALALWGLLPGRFEGARYRLDALDRLLVRVGCDGHEGLARTAWKLRALHLSLVPRFAAHLGGLR